MYLLFGGKIGKDVFDIKEKENSKITNEENNTYIKNINIYISDLLKNLNPVENFNIFKKLNTTDKSIYKLLKEYDNIIKILYLIFSLYILYKNSLINWKVIILLYIFIYANGFYKFRKGYEVSLLSGIILILYLLYLYINKKPKKEINKKEKINKKEEIIKIKSDGYFER